MDPYSLILAGRRYVCMQGRRGRSAMSIYHACIR